MSKVFQNSKWLTAVVMFALFPACLDQGVNVDFSSIPDAYTRWQAYGLRSYTIDQTRHCFCGNGGVPVRLTVENDRIIGAVKLTDGKSLPVNQWEWYKTVEELFGVIQEVERDTTMWFQVRYDARYGYPSNLSVDPISYAADDEYGFVSTNLRRQ